MNGVSQAGGVYHRQFYNNQSNDVEAKNNYWGAGMTNATIDPGIYDNEDGKGEVMFYVFRTGPIPELSTVILFSVGLVAIAGYVTLRKRKNA
ncbi:MAG: hypothetical protein C5S38_02225 [Candidatus Methanophagaceae archaeon]|nr:MAG: hypothetical protein C5S38_02225 [Methanophagales archaeon]